jgi:outer membrane receptor for monomeric catechols
MTFMDLVVMPELASKAGIAYKQGVAPGITVGDPRLANAYTADNVSKGLEFELTYNVNKNWRIMANVAKQEAKQTNIAPQLTAFIEERLAYWKSIPAIWNGLRTSNNPWGLTQTGEEHFNQFLLGSYVGYKSVDGQPSTQLRKWHGSVLTNYTFTEGRFKGFNLGGAARYLDKSIIGNPVITQVVNGTPTIVGLDLAHPYYAGSYIGVDAWVGYRRKIFTDKVIDFQLNVRDLEEGGGFRPIVANSDGTHAVYRIVQPRTFYLTAKLEF